MLICVAALLLAAGCVRLRPAAAPAYTATSMAAVNPQLPPSEARGEAQTRAETQARDQILNQAVQVRLPDGRSLEDLAAIDATVRGQLYDTVRDAHQTDRSVSAEGVITISLSLDKSAIQKIIDDYQKRGGK
jgi:hypothetical protein